MYVKYDFKTGSEWKLLNGIKEGETFECINNDNNEIPLEQPFDLNYSTQY